MILVFGKNGQVATALSGELPEATFISSQEANFLFPEQVIEALHKYKPQIVINASAYTAVDKAESEKQNAEKINAVTPGLIAEWCKTHQAYLIHYSTDYVFKGDGDLPWLEDSPTDPVNWYGMTKRKGEIEILKSQCKAYIFRISWVYSPWGNNFPKTILRLAKERDELKIVSDQWGAPTDARSVAKTTAQVVQSLKQGIEPAPPQIYHLRYENYQTWYDFANKIIKQARDQGEQLKVQKIIPITSDEFPTPAKRPKNSRLGSKYTFFKNSEI